MPLIPTMSSNKKPANKKGLNILKIDCPPTDNISSATYAMIGEAPSNVEVLEGEPFVGPAGAQLNRIIAAAQLPRYEIYLTNACKAQLPKNNSDVLYTKKGYRHPQWGELQRNLINELSEFNGKFIMLLGVTAMKLLLDSPKFDSITKYRGSHYYAEEFPHLKRKLAGKIIILSYHPAFTLHYKNPKAFYVMIMDINKMIRINNDPTLIEDHPKLIIKPTYEKIMEFFMLIKSKDITAFDIEATPKFVTCFSLAIKHNDRIVAMSIPLMDNKGNYWTIEQELNIWIRLAEILIDPDIKLICQNGIFDLIFVLRKLNIISDNFSFDTMLAQHLVYTDLPKGLDFLTSVYTYFPYYKGDGKESHLAVIKDWPSYWKYNARDSAYLFPIMDNLVEELDSFEAMDSMDYQMELHKPLIEMEYNGILTDQDGIKKYSIKLAKRIKALQNGLDKITGRELNINSSKQLIAYFYGILQIKPYINRKTGNATCDTVALHRMAKKNIKGSFEAKIIIKMRKYGKLLSTYFTVNVDADDKLRCTYKIAGTVSGRLASAKTFFETPAGEKIGTNLQNQPYVYKKYLMADLKESYPYSQRLYNKWGTKYLKDKPVPSWVSKTGTKKDFNKHSKIMVEIDLAKAEAHVVAFLCQDENMIEAFESGIDVHSFNASKIFGMTIEDVIAESKSDMESRKTKRYMGKKVVHASNYNMGPGTFSDQLAVENIFMKQSQCKILLDNYKDRFPGLTRWHKQIEEEVRNSRVLYNLFNRPKRFLGAMNSALYRNAYSYKPQSTVAELLNRGMIKMYDDSRLGQELYDLDFLFNVHDSIGFQFDLSQLDNLLDILMICDDHMKHTFTYLGRSFTIGLDAQIGLRWKGNVAEIGKFNQEEINKAIKKIGV